MNQTRVKKHFFVVEDENLQQKFRVKFKEIYTSQWSSFEMQVIEGESFINEDYLETLLIEISSMYSGIGKMTESVGRDKVVFHFDIAR